jgi:hypothetical protein
MDHCLPNRRPARESTQEADINRKANAAKDAIAAMESRHAAD